MWLYTYYVIMGFCLPLKSENSGSCVRFVTFLSVVILSESRAEKVGHFFFLIVSVTLFIDKWNDVLDEIKLKKQKQFTQGRTHGL